MRRPLAVGAVLAALLAAAPAASAGPTMRVPSTGTVSANGLFLACRSTSSSSTSTAYYDQRGDLRTWDCGAGRRPHKGVDISGSTTPGTSPVYAAAAGIVWTAERGNGFGWRVVVRHGMLAGRFVSTVYGHMGNCSSGNSFIAPGIAPGARVAAGTLLGSQGDDAYPSGCASRSHVHFEMRVSDTDVGNVFQATPASPDRYLGIALTADDPSPATSVTAGSGGVAPSPAPPRRRPRLTFPRLPLPWPTFAPH